MLQCELLHCPVSTLTTVSMTVIYIEIFVTLNDQMYVLGVGRHSLQGIWSPRHSSCYINCAIQRYYFSCITSDHLLCRITLVKKSCCLLTLLQLAGVVSSLS